jgi:hypothetical protein
MTLIRPDVTISHRGHRTVSRNLREKPTVRRGNITHVREHCPVEALAVETANVVRAYYALVEPHQRQSASAAALPYLKNELFKPDDGGPTSQAVSDHLRRRIYGLAEGAASMRARSTKGAIFQIYLAANAACFATGGISSGEMVPMDLEHLRAEETKAEYLLASALAVLELDGDEDLKLLRGWFFDSTDQDLLSGDSVIAAVQARGAH